MTDPNLPTGGDIAPGLRHDFQPPAHIDDLPNVLRNLIDDGGFQPRSAEVEKIRQYLATLKTIEDQIPGTCEDHIRSAHKAALRNSGGPLTEPIESKVNAGREFRRVLKARRGELTASIAPTINSMLTRAQQSADIAFALVLENEESRASGFGVPFEPSTTLRALSVARKMLHEHVRNSERVPDLIDVKSICRLLDLGLE